MAIYHRCMYVYIYIYIYIRTHTHTHMYMMGSPHGVATNMLICYVVMSEFEL